MYVSLGIYYDIHSNDWSQIHISNIISHGNINVIFMTKNIENMYPSCTVNVFYDIVVDVYLYIWFRIFKKRWSHRTSNTYMEILNSGKCKSCFSKVLQEMKLSRPEDNNYFHYYHCPFINEHFFITSGVARLYLEPSNKVSTL